MRCTLIIFPVWAKVYNITEEEKYLDFLMVEYKGTTDFLFDKEESLYYRDESYIGKLDNNIKYFGQEETV